MSYVYWVYDLGCGSEIDSGYVGITEDPDARLLRLRSAGTVPRHAKMKVLFQGKRQDCLALEKTLRPSSGIGWNRAVGGVAPKPLKHGFTPISSDPHCFAGFWE
jgi:hypothetical protein